MRIRCGLLVGGRLSKGPCLGAVLPLPASFHSSLALFDFESSGLRDARFALDSAGAAKRRLELLHAEAQIILPIPHMMQLRCEAGQTSRNRRADFRPLR